MVYNPSIPWEVTEHPWLHLATITFTQELPPDVSELTRYNIGMIFSAMFLFVIQLKVLS